MLKRYAECKEITRKEMHVVAKMQKNKFRYTREKQFTLEQRVPLANMPVVLFSAQVRAIQERNTNTRLIALERKRKECAASTGQVPE